VNKLWMSIVILFFTNIMAWWQLNGQFYFKEGHPFWKNPYWMALYGMPIGFLFWWATKFSYDHFGFTWNIRLMGFGLGTIVFGIMSYIFLEEIPTVKTLICLLLAAAIVLIQVTNVIGE